jgi:hypothetical protein
MLNKQRKDQLQIAQRQLVTAVERELAMEKLHGMQAGCLKTAPAP